MKGLSAGNFCGKWLGGRAILVLIGAMVLSATSAIMFAQTESQRMKVAIVGLEHGHVAGFLSQLPHHNDVELVGIADEHADLRAKYARDFHLPDSLFYEKMANMLEKTHPDAVLVYTPISEHRHAIEIAAQYGVPVMVEKPLTISLDDALAIRATSKKYHIPVLVNYETTWYASNRMAYDELEQGRLGPARRVVVHDGHEGPKEIHVQPEFLAWLTDPAQNGAGALYDFGCYGVDLMTWLMHGETPLTVTAIVNHDKPQIYPRVDDDATIILQYPHAQAVIQASWNWPFGRKDMEVYGANGYAITVGADQVRLRLQNERIERTATAPSLRSNERDSLSYLAAVLHKQIVPKGDLTALDTNVTVMQILDAARESARTGRTIRLNRIGE
ncbi:MAG TPA: Gfo/Idh/MocA family oxidoreductase [Terracidiphilus sp.]|nr:Gfo/Idh/MocA family oxidoreductase [Terracidiphilus sp.]